MTDSTAKGEAMQAIRLLRGYALSHELTQAQIETLYQASRLLEGFIDGAGVLEATEFSILPEIHVIGGIRYATNETVRFSKWHDETAKIVCILAQQNMILIRLNTGTVTPLYFGELMKLNPEGSK